MEKPDNPYTQGTVIWAVMEGDWADLTVNQIAEVLDVDDPMDIRNCIKRIKKRTGYDVPRTRERRKS